MNEENDVNVFKSYLRAILRELKALKEAFEKKDYEKAEKLIDQLIEDARKGIED